MAIFLLTLLSLLIMCSILNAKPFDFGCKIGTCNDFYYGLKDYPRRNEYKAICVDTVSALQDIPREHGKCIYESTGKLNAPCIYALASVIKKCIGRMHDLPEQTARYYCGYTLMTYCAEQLGLEGHPLNFNL